MVLSTATARADAQTTSCQCAAEHADNSSRAEVDQHERNTHTDDGREQSDDVASSNSAGKGGEKGGHINDGSIRLITSSHKKIWVRGQESNLRLRITKPPS